jgi:hypothetical protein
MSLRSLAATIIALYINFGCASGVSRDSGSSGKSSDAGPTRIVEGPGTSSSSGGAPTVSSGGTGGPANSSGGAATQLGPNCESYYGTCCPSLAEGIPAGSAKDMLLKSCTDGKEAATKALSNGSTAAQLEASCQKAIDTAKMQNKCK